MVEQFGLLIHEPAAPSMSKATVVSPFDGKQIAEVALCNAAHVDHALAVAHALYSDRSAWLGLPERIKILQNAADIMSEQAEFLALEAAREGGKPLRDSQVEVARAIDGMSLCIEALKSDQGEIIPMGMAASSQHRIAFTQKEPIGVVVAVSAFNHPLNLIVHQAAAAVAAGCPVIIKPAGDTPLSCFRFVKILHQAGLPTSWCQALLTESRDSAEKLVTDKRVGFFSFIGSAAVGWMLKSKLAPGVRCALEHGGVAPVILAEDADMDVALPALLKGGFYHAGQVCVSVQRVYVPQAQAESFAQRLAQEAKKLVVGDPTEASTDIGPLIRPVEVTRVAEWVDEAVAAGAQRLSGGDKLSESCYPCTVLLNPPDDAKVSQSEVFGPVVCVYSYQDIDEAIDRANALEVSFQAAVFTANINTAMKVFKGLNASAVMVNDHTAFRIDGMPFAGLKSSGLGVGGVPHTIEEMQISKMMVINSPDI